jgi:hypothetical protein
MMKFDLFSLPIFGTNAKKLVRKDDPDTSHQAALKVDTTKLEQLVYETIKSYGAGGCISDQVLANFPHLPYSSVTARYKALMTKCLIEDTGERRAGKSGRPQRVMRIIQE